MGQCCSCEKKSAIPPRVMQQLVSKLRDIRGIYPGTSLCLLIGPDGKLM